jgi:hypothetical protein
MRTDGQKIDIQTNGRMDLTKLIVTFRNFANVPSEGFYEVWILCRGRLGCDTVNFVGVYKHV